jgi:hypothetical protein
VRPIEQRLTDLSLELSDADTDCRLRAKHALRSSEETTLFDDCHEHFELHQFHVKFSRPFLLLQKRKGPLSTSDNDPWHRIKIFLRWSLSGSGVHTNSPNTDNDYSKDAIEVGNHSRSSCIRTWSRRVRLDEGEAGLKSSSHRLYRIPRSSLVSLINFIYLELPACLTREIQTDQIAPESFAARMGFAHSGVPPTGSFLLAAHGKSWRTLLQTFRTKVFLSMSNEFSAKTASSLCGREDRFKASYNFSESGHDAHINLLTGKAVSE